MTLIQPNQRHRRTRFGEASGLHPCYQADLRRLVNDGKMLPCPPRPGAVTAWRVGPSPQVKGTPLLLIINFPNHVHRKKSARLAQLVERLLHTQEVRGFDPHSEYFFSLIDPVLFPACEKFFFPLVIPQGSPETTPTQLEHTSVRFSVLSRSFGFLRPPLELTTIGSVMIALGTTGRTRFRNHHSFPAETMWIHVRRSALRQLEESSRNYGKIHQ
jgi:hypothetical protein